MRDGIGNNDMAVEGLAFGVDTPPWVFWGKRLRAIEKKGGESKKERQEIALRGSG
jgi:hypothetical protein